MTRKSRLIKWLLISGSTLLVLAIIIGVWIPSYIKNKVNERLLTVGHYAVTYRDLDVAVWKGSYTIHDLQLTKVSTNIPVPFFSVEKIQFSIDWYSILSSELVGRVSLKNPVINFVRGPSESTSQTSFHDEWITVLNSLIPVPINNFFIEHGVISFHDFHSFPKIKLAITNITFSGNNLRNLEEKESILPATIRGRGDLYDGDIVLEIMVNPLQSQPLFAMDTRITGVSLVNLADFLKTYYNVTVTKGSIDIQHISKVTDATVQGFVKTSLTGVWAVPYKASDKHTKNRGDSLYKLASWRSSKNLVNDSIPVEGKIMKYSGNMWSLIGETLTYAFNCSIASSLEPSVKSPPLKRHKKQRNRLHAKEAEKKKGFLERIFGKKDDKEKKSRN